MSPPPYDDESSSSECLCEKTPLAPFPVAAPTQNCQLELKKLQSNLNATKDQEMYYREYVSFLVKEADNMRKLLKSYLPNNFNGTKLIMQGNSAPGDPIVSIRKLMKENLQLENFDNKILDAMKTPFGIIFTVDSWRDKNIILEQAEIYLGKSKMSIREYFDSDVVVGTKSTNDIGTLFVNEEKGVDVATTSTTTTTLNPVDQIDVRGDFS